MSSIRNVKQRSVGLNCLSGQKFRKNPNLSSNRKPFGPRKKAYPGTSTIKNMEEASEYEPEYESIR